MMADCGFGIAGFELWILNERMHRNLMTKTLGDPQYEFHNPQSAIRNP